MYQSPAGTIGQSTLDRCIVQIVYEGAATKLKEQHLCNSMYHPATIKIIL